MNFFRFLFIFHVFSALLSARAWAQVRASNVCKPFQIHSRAMPPMLWQNTPSLLAQSSVTEEDLLLKEISKTRTQENFEAVYKEWLQNHAREYSPLERRNWLTCILFYVRMDTDQDGIPDWSATNDGTPARVLFPQDDDLDGDGAPNIFDPEPFNSKAKGSPLHAGQIPEHLRDSRSNVAKLQAELFRDYGILAINHTDDHAADILESFIFLMQNSLGSTSVRELKNLRLLYAFKGHDARRNIAAYHPGARAISIGGILTYSEKNPSKADIRVLSAIAHEIGHAFLFERVSPEELRNVSEIYGKWHSVFRGSSPLSLFSSSFLKPYPVPADQNLFVSGYATTNVHEWFADSFAAAALIKLGQSGRLGLNWKEKLILPQRSRGEYWANYNQVRPDFLKWLDTKLSARAGVERSWASLPRMQSSRPKHRQELSSRHPGPDESQDSSRTD